MAPHPYSALPPQAYWRHAVAHPGAAEEGLHRPRWPIGRELRIAVAGSCFAQHVGGRLRRRGFNVLDLEPPPARLPETLHAEFGYGLYSARYGNIYTLRQLLELSEEALGRRVPSAMVWRKGARFVDPLRPTIEPEGLASPALVRAHRERHIERVGQLLRQTDVFVFTLGLTEHWVDIRTERALPVCPGVVAGEFNPRVHAFRNSGLDDLRREFLAFRDLLHAAAPGAPPRILLTVSPVPLTATGSGAHVLQATMQSKALLRAAAADFCDRFEDVDYFPSFEIVANPWSRQDFFAANRRSVTEAGVETVMSAFFAAYGVSPQQTAAPLLTQDNEALAPDEDEIALARCDEELLDAFGPGAR